MTDLDLDKLARRTPPAADSSARAQALAAAMQAFDDAEKNATAPQGSTDGGRRSSMFNWIWSPIMNRKLLAGSALATLLVVPVAGLVTYELVRNGTVPLTAETEIAAKPVDQDLRGRVQKLEDTEFDAKEVATALANGQGGAAKRSADAAVVATDSRKNAGAAEPAPLAETQDEEAAVMSESLAVGGAANMDMLNRSIVQPSAVADAIAMPTPEEDRERFASADPNPVKNVATDPVSTFSADVDTASYSYVRGSLLGGSLPDAEAVRVEELVNYFPYYWKGPETAEKPFNATVTVM
ncbi:MAG: VWA domain-containing protein, partial [Shinella sp.]